MNQQIQDWLEISGALLQTLLPKGPGVEVFGVGMSADGFAALVERESARVDHALIALATAVDEAQVRALFGQLSGDTVIALFSRWAHYTQAWQSLLNQRDPRHWLPPNRNDWWRAVFLAMTGENWYSTEAARSLWPQAFSTTSEKG